MANKAGKGSQFERSICEKLSLWWTQDLEEPRTDIFWRTGGSGARAKVRGRKGKQTYGQGGDIAATDPIGDPLISVFTIECKRGYSSHTIANLLDKPKTGAKQEYEKWFEQAKESADHAGNTWMLITRRNHKEALVFLDENFWADHFGERQLIPNICLEFDIARNTLLRVFGTTLEEFLENIHPEEIRDIANQQRNALRLGQEYKYKKT